MIEHRRKWSAGILTRIGVLSLATIFSPNLVLGGGWEPEPIGRAPDARLESRTYYNGTEDLPPSYGAGPRRLCDEGLDGGIDQMPPDYVAQLDAYGNPVPPAQTEPQPHPPSRDDPLCGD